MAGLFGNVIEFGLKQYDKRKPREEQPLNKRIFLETVLDNNKQQITEANLSPAEQEALRKVILNKYNKPELKQTVSGYKTFLEQRLQQNEVFKKAKNKDKVLYPEVEKQYSEDLNSIKAFEKGQLTPSFLSLAQGNMSAITKDAIQRNVGLSGGELKEIFNVKPSVQYADYGINIQGARSATKQHSPEEQLATFLGRFNFDVDPKTNKVFIKDTYDFNPPVSTLTGQPKQQPSSALGLEGLPVALDTGGSGLYGIIRDYAGMKVPPGQGREVLINLDNTGFEPTIK